MRHFAFCPRGGLTPTPRQPVVRDLGLTAMTFVAGNVAAANAGRSRE